jgi:glycosyltransferase involved in cell wall biosynthesis
VDVLFVDGPASRLNYLRGVRDLHRKLREAPYDLIHAHYVFSGIIALTQRRLPIVLTQHGIEAQVGWTAPLCRLTSRLTAVTIVTSPTVAAAIGLPGVKIIPCGVDTELFRPGARAEARAALGLPADAPLALFVGALRPEKRLPLIREAMARLQADLPAARLVTAHTEPRERIPLYMNACDVLLLASTAEGAPMVVREAMACNLPVVSTDVGDVRELCAGLPGHFIAAATPDGLAEQIRLALAFGRRTEGRSRILPWSLESVARQIIEIYRQALGR